MAKINESSEQGKRIHRAEKTFNMECADVPQTRVDYVKQPGPVNRAVKLAEYEKQFAKVH